MGIKKGATDGTSGFFRRRCYGYQNNESGDLRIVPEEAEAVRFIFALCLKGASLNRIQDELCQRKIPSPTGKDAWCKQSINMLLSREKYNGDVMLMKSVSLGSIGSKRMRSDGQADKYLAVSNHPPIIDKETFEAAQKEKLKRSSIMGIDSIVKR